MFKIAPIKQNVVAYIFSTNATRTMFVVPPGNYELDKIEYTSWGETIAYFNGLPPLITGTHWGCTPFVECIEYKE